MDVSGLGAIGTQPIIQPVKPQAPAGAGGPGEKDGFGGALRGALRTVDQDQAASAETVRQLLTGNGQDILPTVAAVAKADMSFKLLIGVRNKVIEAYKQTINMQI